MANPNRTAAEFFRKNPRVRSEAEMASERARHDASPFKVIMDKVQSGEWTAEQGVEAVNRINAQ